MRQHITIPHTGRKFVPRQNNNLRVSSAIHRGNIVDLPIYVGDTNFHALRSPEYQAFYLVAKRMMDLIFSVALILIASPLLMVIAVLVKTTSRGPLLYKSRRIGQSGHIIECWKFRTMVSDADDILEKNPELRRRFEEKFKLDEDPRITKIGKFLRDSSLDELPQLFQVVYGTLSLIGPRPILEKQLDKYSIYGRKLISVKPGLGGLWQVSGRSSLSHSERILLDMNYIDHRGIRLDLLLFWLTAISVFKRTGAC